jgi:beta-ribofuranosylaminobenzene 5'-phosphate synthase
MSPDRQTGAMATVRTGARLHLGFQDLSLAHERLYGGVGLALAEPTVEITARPASTLECDDAALEPAVADAVAALGVDGAAVRVEDRFERHVGLGSGTQLALSCLVAVAAAHDEPVDVRERAPALGRGGRSGVGVATFEAGGFVVDAGHPSERFTAEPPPAGKWTVPSPIVRSSLPRDWRFVLVQPEAEPGPSGPPEDERMRAVVERADPGIADEIATLLTRRLLPAVAEGDHRAFGRAAARLGRLNGAWFADEQGGVYRPPAGRIVEALGDEPAVSGTGQSSWGPTVYGVTDAEGVEAALAAGRDALDDLGLDGSVRAVRPRNEGASRT